MLADECPLLVEERSCSGHHCHDRFRPDFVRWALTPEGRHRKMAVTYQHFLLVGLLVALPGLAYAENAGPPPVPRFEPAPCPKLSGADELTKASCGYLVVPENRSRPSGRTIRLMVARYPARSPEKRAS